MPVLPVTHFDWQVLRTVKRSKKPPIGRLLRLYPLRRTKDGSFLTKMVERGLLRRVTGESTAPFEATYALTERGEHAAEYGEADFPAKPNAIETQPEQRKQVRPAKMKRSATQR